MSPMSNSQIRLRGWLPIYPLQPRIKSPNHPSQKENAKEMREFQWENSKGTCSMGQLQREKSKKEDSKGEKYQWNSKGTCPRRKLCEGQLPMAKRQWENANEKVQSDNSDGKQNEWEKSAGNIGCLSRTHSHQSITPARRASFPAPWKHTPQMNTDLSHPKSTKTTKSPFLSGLANTSLNSVFSTKIVFPKSRKFLNSGSDKCTWKSHWCRPCNMGAMTGQDSQLEDRVRGSFCRNRVSPAASSSSYSGSLAH